MKNLLISFFFCVAFGSIHAQQYTYAIGVKGTYATTDIVGADLSFKHFFQSPNAIEANIGFSRNYVWLQGLYMRSFPLKRDFEWYLGAGGDAGYWQRNYIQQYNGRSFQGFWVGVDGVVGVEYTFTTFPINISVDAGPTLRMVPYVHMVVTSRCLWSLAIR